MKTIKSLNKINGDKDEKMLLLKQQLKDQQHKIESLNKINGNKEKEMVLLKQQLKKQQDTIKSLNQKKEMDGKQTQLLQQQLMQTNGKYQSLLKKNLNDTTKIEMLQNKLQQQQDNFDSMRKTLQDYKQTNKRQQQQHIEEVAALQCEIKKYLREMTESAAKSEQTQIVIEALKKKVHNETRCGEDQAATIGTIVKQIKDLRHRIYIYEWKQENKDLWIDILSYERDNLVFNSEMLDELSLYQPLQQRWMDSSQYTAPINPMGFYEWWDLRINPLVPSKYPSAAFIFELIKRYHGHLERWKNVHSHNNDHY